MEKAVPFATGYRFKVKQQRYLALQYELTINFLIEDCKVFFSYLLCICASSIIYNVFELFSGVDGFLDALFHSTGILSSGFGVYVSVVSIQSYKSLKVKMIKRNIGLLIAFFIAHLVHLFVIALEEMIFEYGFISKFFWFLGPFGCIYLFVFSYFLIANKELVEVIKEFHMLN